MGCYPSTAIDYPAGPMNRVAFVVLSHANPPQLRRLIHSLNHVYDAPRILIHHDFHQCALDSFPQFPNVHFVQPARHTGWGDFSLVEATVDALRMLGEPGEPFDWFAVLSGADYPVRPGPETRHELARLECDVCMRFEEIHPAAVRRGWHAECVDRYFGVDIPRPRSAPHGIRMEYHRVTSPWLLRLLSPYSRRFRCFAGSQWFSARAHVARRIVQLHEENPWLAQHLKTRACPDETYFQTLLCNDSGLRLRNDHLRYIVWKGHGAHPKLLGPEDLPAILASGAHFARKFAPGSAALDELDRLLGVPPQPA
jgi:hypothetical protein